MVGLKTITPLTTIRTCKNLGFVREILPRQALFARTIFIHCVALARLALRAGGPAGIPGLQRGFDGA